MSDPVVRYVALQLCQPCIDGEGQECHTPGCALFLHKVDLPIHEELLIDAAALEARVRELEKTLAVELAVNDQLAARVRELEAERDMSLSRLTSLEDEKNDYIEYVGDALGQDYDRESLWDAAQRVLSERDRLRALAEEAIESIEDWAGYADAYFQNKHDLQGELARLRAALKG